MTVSSSEQRVSSGALPPVFFVDGSERLVGKVNDAFFEEKGRQVDLVCACWEEPAAVLVGFDSETECRTQCEPWRGCPASHRVALLG